MRNTTLYSIGGTSTFRLASKAILRKWGTNLQNIEKGMRKIYIPDDGKIFVQVDQAGAEAVIVAYITRPGNYRKLVENGIKIHTFCALHNHADVWQKELNKNAGEHALDVKEFINADIESLPKHPRWKELSKVIASSDSWEPQRRYYYINKQVAHSSNYGITANMLRLNILEKSRGRIVLTTEEAKQFLDFYHGLFPEIRLWHKEVEDILHESRVLRNLFGYPRYFGGELEPSALKEAYAFIPQSTVGTITNTAYTKLQHYIEENNLDWDLLANTHDSYLCQCPILESKECANKMQEFINQEFTYRGTAFCMKSEAQCGYNWSPKDDKKNPFGLS